MELSLRQDTLLQDFCFVRKLISNIFLKFGSSFGGKISVKGNNDAGLKERLDWIDFAKGIGIILVVWAHTRGFFTNYIEQFHMPLFFFVSGYLYQYNGGG